MDYAYISNHERMAFTVDEDWYAANWNLVFSEGDVNVYALPEGD